MNNFRGIKYNKLQEILDFLNEGDNLNIVYDLIIKKDIHMFKYIDKDVFNDFIKDVQDEAVSDISSWED